MALVTASWLLDALLLVTVLLTLLYRYLNSTRDYFKDRGIPCVTLRPVLGLLESLQNFQIDKVKTLYDQFPEDRFFGMFLLKLPILVIKDLDLVQRIMVKDFAHFSDRPSPHVEFDKTSQNLFNLRGSTWRALRQKITPTFSSGKLKQMFEEISKCVDHLLEEVERFSETEECVEAKQFVNGFTTEVIGSTAFGLDLSNSNPRASEFKQMVSDLLNSPIRQMLTFLLSTLAPKVTDFFRITAMPKHVVEYFVSLTVTTKEYRKRNNVQRNDYFQVLLNLQEQEESGESLVSESKNLGFESNEEDALIDQMQYSPQEHKAESGKTLLTDEMLTAQTIIFLTAGTDSVSGTLGFLLYHLARDQRLQGRLVEEVDRVLARHGGCCYEAIKEMTFLDQLIQETQRMYPTVPVLLRECTTPYSIPDSDVVLHKGMFVIIPLAGLHADPKYYPSPEHFDPDRFADNHHKPNPTYMPFGDGPRICIALRFALLEMKVCVAKLVSQYSLELNGKTKEPLTFDKKSFFLKPEGGLWISFKKRSETERPGVKTVPPE